MLSKDDDQTKVCCHMTIGGLAPMGERRKEKFDRADPETRGTQLSVAAFWACAARRLR